jgi:hypothetical protein
MTEILVENFPIRSKQCRSNLQVLNVNDNMIKLWAKIPIFPPYPNTYLSTTIHDWYYIAQKKNQYAEEWCSEICKSRWAITNIQKDQAVLLGWLNSNDAYNTWEDHQKARRKYGPYVIFKAKWEAVHFKMCLV